MLRAFSHPGSGLLFWLMGVSSVSMWGQGKCVNGWIQGQWPCESVELLAHVPNADMGGLNANDLWGWTDPEDGREYVLFGQRDGTWFVDVTDPSLPRIVGELPSTGLANSKWRDVKVVGHHMVVVSEVQQSRLQVFDLTRLRDHTVIGPPITFSTDTLVSGFSKAHNVAVLESDSMVYVCGPSGIDGLLVYDFSQGDAPALVGSWSESYVHDAHVVLYQGPDSDHVGKRIAVVSASDNIRILDVTDPMDIMELSVTGPVPYGYVHQGWFSEDHSHFLLGDESDESAGIVDETTTYVFDVSDLDAPFLISSESLGTHGSDHNLFVRGPWVHQSNYQDGYRLFRFQPDSDSTLVATGLFDTQPDSDGPGFDGSWSNYPYFDSGTIAVSDQYEGLFLIQTQLVTGWPEFSAVCPSDTLRLRLEVQDCIEGPVNLMLPEGVAWMSETVLSGPGEFEVLLTGFDWNGMGNFILRAEAEGAVHAGRYYVDVTDDALHYPDADGDGYGVFDGALAGCCPGPGYAHVGGDCNDADENVCPGAVDLCDGVDNDCDATIDEDGLSTPFFFDLDGDGVPGPTQYEACVPPPGAHFDVGQDCNDLDATMYPGAEPTLMGVDNDCNGHVLGLEQLDGGCPGDLNGDDVVTIQDLLEFLNLFGSSGFFEADLNFDEHVGVADLLLMLGLLGATC